MHRFFLPAAFLLFLTATCTRAQIAGNPVITSMPPYPSVTGTPTAVTTYRPNAAACCTPAPPTIVYRAAPVPSCAAPPTVVGYAPAAPIRTYYPPATSSLQTVRYPSRTTYYAPTTAYVPPPTAGPIYRAPAPVRPTTSYYAPAAPNYVSSPTTGSGCGCNGR